jgi:uncharacterized protein YraI
MRRRAPVALLLTAGLVLGLAACGDDDEGTGGSTATTGSAGSSASDPEGSTTTAPGSTTTEATTTTTAEADLPGEAIDIPPGEGAALAVVGVAAGDTLNVRSGPGSDLDVVTELAPLAAGFAATGRNRVLDDDSVWAEVEADGATGWVNAAYVAQLGTAADVTADVPATSAATVAALAEAVAAGRAGEGEGPTPTVTIVDGPTDSEVTVDLIGLADDAQRGERLYIVATAEGDGFTATVVEATALCARGVTDGLCA